MLLNPSLMLYCAMITDCQPNLLRQFCMKRVSDIVQPA